MHATSSRRLLTASCPAWRNTAPIPVVYDRLSTELAFIPTVPSTISAHFGTQICPLLHLSTSVLAFVTACFLLKINSEDNAPLQHVSLSNALGADQAIPGTIRPLVHVKLGHRVAQL